jgi:hypothetical protein
MAAQLRIDAARLVKEQPVLAYSHTTSAPLPQAPQGYGCAWATVEDMLAQARTLRDWLAQPEQLVLLHLLAAFDVDKPVLAPTEAEVALHSLVGKRAMQVGGAVTILGRLP